ncbi:MAG: hypothetical protein Q7K34_04365 [archaeon]|nr:hypothetical protein [archaeon]
MPGRERKHRRKYFVGEAEPGDGPFSAGKRHALTEHGARGLEERVRKRISLEILAADSNFRYCERRFEAALLARPRGLRGLVYDKKLAALHGKVLKGKLLHWETILTCMRTMPNFMPPKLNVLLNVQDQVVMQHGPLGRGIERRFLALLARKRFSAEAGLLLDSLKHDTGFHMQLRYRRDRKDKLNKLIDEAHLTARNILIDFRKAGKFSPVQVRNYLGSIVKVLDMQHTLAKAYVEIFSIMGKRARSLGLGIGFRKRLYELQGDVNLVSGSVAGELAFWRLQYKLEGYKIAGKTHG